MQDNEEYTIIDNIYELFGSFFEKHSLFEQGLKENLCKNSSTKSWFPQMPVADYDKNTMVDNI